MFSVCEYIITVSYVSLVLHVLVIVPYVLVIFPDSSHRSGCRLQTEAVCNPLLCDWLRGDGLRSVDYWMKKGHARLSLLTSRTSMWVVHVAIFSEPELFFRVKPMSISQWVEASLPLVGV